MSNTGYITLVLAFALMMTVGDATWSQQATPFTSAELDELFAPIALYPDPLLAQILPAATYPEQLFAASEFTGYQARSGIDNQPWDVSVKAVAYYPDVLKMMVESPDWTIAIGQAYVNQPDDVMRSIQRLRGKARLMGYLNSNSQQTVSVSNGYISIVPAQARYIYVPTYNPGVVYVERRPSYGTSAFIFGAGLLIGAWLNNSINWNQNRVYNHGWRGDGWINRARPHVRTNNPHYVNRAWTNRPVPINRNVRSRDITPYRNEVRRGAGTYTTPGFVRPTRPSTGVRPGAPTVTPRVPGTRPGTPAVRPAPRPAPPRQAPRPGTRPGATVTPRTPGAGPNTPANRPGVTRPTPTTRPGAGVAVPTTRPKPSPGVTRPSAGTRPSPGVTRPTQTTRPGASLTRPSAGTRPSLTRPSSGTKSGAGVTRQGTKSKPSGQQARPSGNAKQGKSERK